MILHGVEGIGKTSFAAMAPKPIVLMGRGETGLETLIDNGQIPDTPHYPELQTWPEVMAAMADLEREEHQYKTLIVDTVNVLERLCHEEVCRKSFNNDWSDKGFMGYHRGFEIALADWREFLIAVDRLRENKRMGFIGLCHTKVHNFKNPEGPDYDRYVPAVHSKTWELTARWADMILFANYETFVQAERGARPKGQGGQNRILYTERSAAFDAKHRHGLPTEIEMGGDGRNSWNVFQKALVEAKKG